jgi:acetyl-CoA/propionyl-CoA carboxylase biotin carboxyl carrier protein
VPTTIPFHRVAVTHADFLAARHSTASVEREWDLSGMSLADTGSRDTDATAGGRREERLTVELDGRRFDVRVHTEVPPSATPRRARRGGPSSARPGSSGEILAPMQGTVIGYSVEPGARVAEGDPVVTLEALKMENTLRSPVAGTVTSTGTTPGTVVQPGALLAVIEPD